VPVHPETPSGSIARSTVWDKFGHFIEALFVRQNYVVDRTILTLFWAIVLIALWFGRRRLAQYLDLAIICLLAAAIYFILPFGLAGVSYVDERALPFFLIPLLMLALRIFETSGRAGNRLILACALLAAANLASLASFLPRQNRQTAIYREALSRIPSGKNVLPIYTLPRDGNTYPLRHAGSYYIADREGYAPYLFSQVSASGPAGYFKDLSPIYRPTQDWYLNHIEPDWKKIEASYDYVVITNPWLDSRIDTRQLELYYRNSAATVFRVRPRQPEVLYPQSAK
jgi:hypothetical protein